MPLYLIYYKFYPIRKMKKDNYFFSQYEKHIYLILYLYLLHVFYMICLNVSNLDIRILISLTGQKVS